MEQTKKINAYLRKEGRNVKACAEHTLEELNDKIRAMWSHMSSELQQIYQGRDLRQLAHKTLEGFETRWKSELAEVDLHMDASALPALRDGKCAEVLMIWVHHVHEDGKKALRDMVLPALEEFNIDHATKQPTNVASRYTSSYTCVTGHNMRSNHTSDHKFPHWPEEVHYQGRGHGAYPFWAGGGGSGGSAAIDVYWSEKQLAERFYHASCSMTEVGYSKDTACYHLFVGGQPNPAAYLFTATKDFCCISGPTSSRGFRSLSHSRTSFPPPPGPGGSEKLAPPQSDFMDDFTLAATEDFNGDFYQGKVKRYLMQLAGTEAVTWFWYVTTEDGKPVEQGEGGKSEKDDSGQGIQIWHEYNTSTFKSATVDPSIFDVPEVCKSTTKTCAFP
jgi:hypothetical protein